MEPENREKTGKNPPEEHRFKPGQSGNPGGRPKKRVISEIYEQMLADPEFVGEIEDSIRKMVRSGRMVGQLLLKEMTERTEGKVVQPIEGDVTISTLAERMALAEQRISDGSSTGS